MQNFHENANNLANIRKSTRAVEKQAKHSPVPYSIRYFYTQFIDYNSRAKRNVVKTFRFISQKFFQLKKETNATKEEEKNTPKMYKE